MAPRARRCYDDANVNILEVLEVEHGVLLRTLTLMDQFAATRPAANALQEMAGMVTRLLLAHATMEDEILMAGLEAKATGDMRDVMTRHHASHVDIERLFREAVEEGPGAVPATLSATAFTRAHICQEERELFPLARQALGEAELVRLGARAEAYLALIRT
jgi:hemerythrin-like domain-containing protein